MGKTQPLNTIEAAVDTRPGFWYPTSFVKGSVHPHLSRGSYSRIHWTSHIRAESGQSDQWDYFWRNGIHSHMADSYVYSLSGLPVNLSLLIGKLIPFVLLLWLCAAGIKVAKDQLVTSH